MMPYCFFMRSPLLFVPSHIWRDHVLKTFGLALLLASGLAIAGAPVRALQIVVTQVDKNTDGSMTYHFAVKTDQGETLAPGESKETSDFVTVYNFYGLVDGSAKSPEGWEFSSEEFGRTPTLNGYPMVLPVDVPNTPNLTWTLSTRRRSRACRPLSEASPPECRVPRLWCPNRRLSAGF